MVHTNPISHGVGKIEIGGRFLEHSFGVENGREREYDGLATIVKKYGREIVIRRDGARSRIIIHGHKCFYKLRSDDIRVIL